MNSPLKFLTARKILPLLNSLAKLNECLLARAPQIFALLASSQSKFISALARKKIAALGMLANACKAIRHLLQALAGNSIHFHNIVFFLILFLIMHPEPSIFDYKNKCENKKIYASSLFTMVHKLSIFSFFLACLGRVSTHSYCANIWNECNACCAGSF